MFPQLKEIVANLETLEDLCGRMVQLTMTEREALIKGNLETLNGISESKNALSRKIGLLRDRTRELVLEMAPEGSKAETVEQLLPLMPEEVQNTLARPYASFRERASELRFHNTHNMILAKHGLKSIEGRVSTIVSAIQGAKTTYKRPGQTLNGPMARLGRVHREA